MSQPIEVTKGVRLVRTVVSDQPTNVQVNVVNTSDQPVTLPQGLPLGRLEEVQLIETKPAPSDANPPTVGDTTHVDTLLQEVDDSVDDTARGKLHGLLRQHTDVFSRNEYDLGCATMVKHRIDTGSNRPFRQPLRRQPAHLLPIIDEQLQEMQKQGIIRPAQSEWAPTWSWSRKRTAASDFAWIIVS